MDCRTDLIATNIRWLRQAIDLLERLEDGVYATSPVGLEPHRAGGHLRHIIEFYRAFLEAAADGRINYDARQRDVALERSRTAAASAIRSIIRDLETAAALPGDAAVWVRMEDAPNTRDAYMRSSMSRELQVLSSHTIHHFALMAVTLRAHGVAMDGSFGMAPSTLRYLASRPAEAA